ncbi:hypothetical protein PR048_010107 [Dryococelus australis]|uniref:GAG-pre-integrase domain-containing protein n=1 Tax=Dryococelus australis TaxID=614101 RepID=A0ABQ9I1T8_9NEOP|nr:hypothetical protein PR048_010107 [Dryococelus australis]
MSEGTGLVKLKSDVDVSDVLYVPDLSANMLSVSKMANRGLKVFFDSEECKVYDDCQIRGNIIVTAVNEGVVYKVKCNSHNINTHKQNDALSVQDVKEKGTTARLPRNLWHRRLGNLNRKSMSQLKSTSIGMDFSDDTDSDCIACVKGKQCRDPYSKHSSV